MPSVGVIIPTRNMADTLWVAVGSACRCGADRIIVIDDASTDATPLVVEHWMGRFPQIEYIRHEQKLPDHNAAQREVYAAIGTDHIIGLAADDYLMPWCIDEIRSNADAAVVFTSVDVLYDGVLFCRTDSAGIEGRATPEAVCDRFKSDANATESGIGSSLRNDVAQWLWSLDWHVLGPCMDSVGYGTAACLHGAHYVRRRSAALSLRERSYGRNPEWGEDFYIDIAKKSMAFMLRAGLDVRTAAAISKKRCMVEVVFDDDLTEEAVA